MVFSPRWLIWKQQAKGQRHGLKDHGRWEGWPSNAAAHRVVIARPVVTPSRSSRSPSAPSSWAGSNPQSQAAEGGEAQAEQMGWRGFSYRPSPGGEVLQHKCLTQGPRPPTHRVPRRRGSGSEPISLATSHLSIRVLQQPLPSTALAAPELFVSPRLPSVASTSHAAVHRPQQLRAGELGVGS